MAVSGYTRRGAMIVFVHAIAYDSTHSEAFVIGSLPERLRFTAAPPPLSLRPRANRIQRRFERRFQGMNEPRPLAKPMTPTTLLGGTPVAGRVSRGGGWGMLQTDIHIRGDMLVVEIELPDAAQGEIELVVDSQLLCLRLSRAETEGCEPEPQRNPRDLYEFVPLPVRVRPQEVECFLDAKKLEFQFTIEKDTDEVIHYRIPRDSQSLRHAQMSRQGCLDATLRIHPPAQSVSGGGLCVVGGMAERARLVSLARPALSTTHRSSAANKQEEEPMQKTTASLRPLKLVASGREEYLAPAAHPDGMEHPPLVTQCAWCNGWNGRRIDSLDSSRATVSHGLCPHCLNTLKRSVPEV